MRVSVAVVATILSILASQLAYAQAGILLGRVTDAETGARVLLSACPVESWQRSSTWNPRKSSRRLCVRSSNNMVCR